MIHWQTKDAYLEGLPRNGSRLRKGGGALTLKKILPQPKRKNKEEGKNFYFLENASGGKDLGLPKKAREKNSLGKHAREKKQQRETTSEGGGAFSFGGDAFLRKRIWTIQKRAFPFPGGALLAFGGGRDETHSSRGRGKQKRKKEGKFYVDDEKAIYCSTGGLRWLGREKAEREEQKLMNPL